MSHLDRHDAGMTWTRFSEANGIVTAQKFHKAVIRSEQVCVASGSERIAGKILDLKKGFAAYVWDVVFVDEMGQTTHSMVRLGIFPQWNSALEAISSRFSWAKSEVRMPDMREAPKSA